MQTFKIETWAGMLRGKILIFVWTWCTYKTRKKSDREEEKKMASGIKQTDEPCMVDFNGTSVATAEAAKKMNVTRKRIWNECYAVWSDSKKHRPYSARNEIYSCAGPSRKMLISHIWAMQTHPRCFIHQFFFVVVCKFVVCQVWCLFLWILFFLSLAVQTTFNVQFFYFFHSVELKARAVICAFLCF